MGKRFQAVKGMRDFPPGSLEIRENIIRTIEDIFKKYGYYKWDGPALEYWETLIRKSGPEVEKEIYVFKDKGGRKVGLRFELTASLARIIASNPNLKLPIKAYSVGKVWRYENPQRGRYREFLQMDADIFGSLSILCEVELLLMATNILNTLGFKDFYILLNNREILESVVKQAGISEQKKLNVFRALDKLSRVGYEGVRNEFIERGLAESEFERFMELIITENNINNFEKIENMKRLLKDDKKAVVGLDKLKKIVEYYSECSDAENIKIDFSLVRGLDYYTGPVFEIKIKNKEEYGSIVGGGRYDELVKLFGGKPTPAVGLSFGIERIIDIIENDNNLRAMHETKPPMVYVISLGEKYVKYALKLSEILRREGIQADFDLMGRNYRKQLQYANEMQYSFVLFVGENEIKSNKYTLKDMSTGIQEKLPISEVIEKLKLKLKEVNHL